MEAPTNYAKRDRVHLAYRVASTGPAILFAPGTYLPISAFDDHPVLARFVGRLAGLGSVITMDRRGVGESDPLQPGDQRLEDWVDDVVAVLDHAGKDQVHVVAGFDTGQMAVALAAGHPARVASLCLIHCVASGPWFRQHWEGDLAASFERVVEEGVEGGVDMLRLVAPSCADDARFRSWFDAAGRKGASPSTAIALADAMFAWDVTDVLAQVQAPTTVINRAGNVVVPAEAGRELAAAIPRATYVELPGEDHLIWVGDEAVLNAVETSLTGVAPALATRELATVMFTDLVSSTEAVTAVGDRRWSELLDVHDTTAGRLIERYGGQFIKNTGDGVLAVFTTPGGAIHCAKDLQQELVALGLSIRAGIHTGEIERRGNDVGGIAVHVAARVLGLAGAGDVVVSSVIPMLTSGAGFIFDDLGDHQLKGVPGDWRLYRAG